MPNTTNAFTHRKNNKITHRASALVAVFTLLFAQTNAHAFLALNKPALVSLNLPGESLAVSAPLFIEKSFVEAAIAPIEESDFSIPQSVIAQFNPMPGSGSYRSKIYYDAAGRRIVRNEFLNKSYFETYNRSTQLEQGKFRTLQFSNSQNYRFYYYNVRNAQAVRIVLASSNQEGKPYQAFEILENGKLGRVLETGLLDGDRFLRQRVFDYNAKTLTLNQLNNVYEKRVYELNSNSQPGRPVQYRNRTEAGELIHIRFIYDDFRKTVTCIHVNNLHFATYEIQQAQLGSLIEMGTASHLSASGQIIPKTQIQITQLHRDSQNIPVYIFHNASTPGYVVRERSVESADGLGIMGRVLRYVSTGIDLEYFYQERTGAQAAVLTVFNHLSQEQIRFEVPEKVFDETQGRLQTPSNVHSVSFDATMNHGVSKFFPLISNLVFGLIGHHTVLRSHEVVSAYTSYLSRLMRGPPALSLENFELSSAHNLSTFFFSFSFLIYSCVSGVTS